ncbi:MAG TPA: hypothetical protein VMS86_10595 [Thermoanaerobaculia bacterium]|nr:hypothetical protein [Thermoanaerobaculia bacterium]
MPRSRTFRLFVNERQFGSWFGRGTGSGTVFARGFVRHRDYRAIHLRCWRQVLPNAAGRASGGYAD